MTRVKSDDLKTSVPASRLSASVSEMSVEIPAWLVPHLEAAAEEGGMSVSEFIAGTLSDKKAWDGFVRGLKATL